jgi:hypothetical protein
LVIIEMVYSLQNRTHARQFGQSKRMVSREKGDVPAEGKREEDADVGRRVVVEKDDRDESSAGSDATCLDGGNHQPLEQAGDRTSRRRSVRAV